MDTTPNLAELFRAYKRSAYNVRDVFDGRAESLALKFELHAAQGEPTRSSFTPGSEVDRLAALLRPFMAGGSKIELTSVWEALLATGDINEGTRAEVEQAFVAADRLSISMAVDDMQLTARDVYFAYGDGQYFADDEEAKRLLDKLSIGPMADMLRMTFHDVCASYAHLVLILLDVILEFERSHPQPEPPAQGEPQCIYCLTREGDFGPEEHVIPESLGGDEVVLRHSVCRHCNNTLSRLDETLLTFEPIAMLRTMYLPLTKAGKFPRAQLKDVDFEKVAPRALRVRSKTRRQSWVVQELPDGVVKISMQMVGRKRFDPVPLARALFKIGLGLVAEQAGREAALASQYDRTRRFILGTDSMPNYLYLPTNLKPGPSISTWWRPAEGGTVVVLDIFGVVFGFNLEATPFRLPPDSPRELFAEFWLGGPGDDEAGEAAARE